MLVHVWEAEGPSAYRRDRHGVHLLGRPEVVADPSLYLRAVRELPPIFFDEVGKVWVCSGYLEAAAILRDHSRFRAARLLDPQQLAARGMTDVAQMASVLAQQMLFLDPPDHTAIRAALHPSFSPSAVAAREATVRSIVEGALSSLPASGRVDLIPTFAGSLPVLLIASRLGLDTRIAELLSWADAYETLLGSVTTLPHARDRAVIPALLKAWAALREEARCRRGGSANDLITVLANALAGANIGSGSLEDALDRVAANCLVLLGGGYQTLTQLVAMGIARLVQHPDQLAMLRADPTLIDGAIDEIMRLEGSSQYVARQAAEDVDLAGQTIHANQSVVVLLAAANLDPRQFSDPERFDIRRSQGKHLGFAVGRHHCLGSIDAEQAARLALLGFAERYESAALSLVPDGIVFGPHANTRAPARVLIDVSPPACGHESARTDSVVGGAVAAAAVASAPRGRRPWSATETETLRSRNDRAVDLAGEQFWMEAVAGHAQRQPDAVALQGPRGASTYAELDRAGNVLAGRLQDMGVEPGTVVGVVMDRGAEAYISALAVGRAGAAFLVADTACPLERLRFMLTEARVTVLCTQANLVHQMRSLVHASVQVHTVDADELVAADDPPPVVAGVRLGDTAYVVFTSGSTGAPKGISVDHEALVNLQVALRQSFRLTPQDRVLQWFPPNFDGWHFDVLLALTSGARLVLAPPAKTCIGPALTRVMRDTGISAATLTPTAWRTVDAGTLPRLRLAALAGEVCTAAAADQLAAVGRRVLNLYGPAEAAIWSTWHECRAGESDPPIGVPVLNKRAYILDRNGRPSALGETGELWVGGVGIGRYLHQPDLMREHFHPDPLATTPGRLMYATGDMCRWRADGRIEYVGRADRQVKVRGQRVELEEIERILAAAPGVRHATVHLDSGLLVATVVTDPGAFVEAAVREYLASRLHSGMVPSIFKVTTQPSLGVTGKLELGSHAPSPVSVPPARDRRMLPPPSDSRAETRLVWQIARLYAACLQVPQTRIRAWSDFFTVGGDSLSLAELLVGIEDGLGVILDVDAVVAAATPEGIARLVTRGRLAD